MTGDRILWINDLSGTVNQATTPHMLANNQFRLLVNADQSEVGAVGHRTGTDLYLNVIAGTGPVQGMGTLEKANGNRYIYMVANGNLYSNRIGVTWTAQDATTPFSASSTVEMAQFIDRMYMIGSGATEYLSKVAANNDTVSTVAGNITGRYLASNGAYLMVVDPDARTAKWSNTASETFDVEDFATISGLATGVGSFGSGRPFVVFTGNNYLVVDPINASTSETRGFGAVSHRSIQNLRGYLVFMGREGLYRLGLNDSFPLEISRVIRNDLTKDTIFDQIAGSSWDVMASVVIKDKYFVAVRDLSSTVKGYTLNDVVIEYDIAAETLKTHTFGAGGIGAAFTQFVDANGDLEIYGGSYDSNAVYKLFVADKYTDDDSTGVENDVTFRVVTKDYSFFSEKEGDVVMQNIPNLHFKYRSEGDLTLKWRLDGKAQDSDTITLPATESGLEWDFFDVPFGKECKSISLDISGTDEALIYGIGFELDSTSATGIKLT